MPGKQENRTSQEAENQFHLTNEQAARWAVVIADGDDDFPNDLAPADFERLASNVREALRQRLVRLIARAVAAKIRGRCHDKSGDFDASQKV